MWQRFKDRAYANQSVLIYLGNIVLLVVAAVWLWFALKISNEIPHGEMTVAQHLISDFGIFALIYITGGLLFWGRLSDAANHKRFRYGPITMTDKEMLDFMEWGKTKGWSQGNDYESGYGGWDNIANQRSIWYTPIRFALVDDYLLVKLKFTFENPCLGEEYPWG